MPASPHPPSLCLKMMQETAMTPETGTSNLVLLAIVCILLFAREAILAGALSAEARVIMR